MKKIITLLSLMSFIITHSQVKDIYEAHDLLMGGWEAVQKKQPSPGRSQFYFLEGDTVNWRHVRTAPPRGCKPHDTVMVDKWWWKVVDFNKRKQVVKILLTPIQRTVRFSCDNGPSPRSPMFIHFKILSKDEFIRRGDNRRYQQHFLRKKDQINWSPR